MVEWSAGSAGVEESAGVGVREGGIPFVDEGSVTSFTMLCVVVKVSRDCVQGEESNTSIII